MRLLIKEIIAYGAFAILMIFTPLNAAPTVANLHASQRIDSTKMVDIEFNIIHNRSVTVSIYASQDNGVTWNLPINLVSGDVGPNIVPGNGKHIVWDVLAEHPNVIYDNVIFKVVADDGVMDLTSGLVAYYPFSGNANDLSVYGNHGIVYGAQLTADRMGNTNQAYYFDGANDYILIQNSPELNPQEELTISAWMKPVSFTGTGNNGIVSKGFTSYTYPYYQYHLALTGNSYYNNPGSFEFYAQQRNVFTPNHTWIPGQWYHVVGRYSTSSIKIFVNGSLSSEGPANGSMSIYSTPVCIGKSSYTNLCTPGTIDDVRIYNRALTESEIMALYNE